MWYFVVLQYFHDGIHLSTVNVSVNHTKNVNYSILVGISHYFLLYFSDVSVFFNYFFIFLLFWISKNFQSIGGLQIVSRVQIVNWLSCTSLACLFILVDLSLRVHTHYWNGPYLNFVKINGLDLCLYKFSLSLSFAHPYSRVLGRAGDALGKLDKVGDGWRGCELLKMVVRVTAIVGEDLEWGDPRCFRRQHHCWKW